MISSLNRGVTKLEAEIRKIIRANTGLFAKQKVMTSICGVGNQVSQTLLALLPELGQLSRSEIVKLAGLAPINQDSGIFSGKRFIHGGRKEVRSMLYMAAVSARAHNPEIKSFYKSLIGRGKEKMVALIACARKLLIYLNGLMKKEIVAI